MDKLEFNKIFTDRFIQTQYSLWNSLITFNTFIIGIVSILFSIDSSFSKCLVIWFYLSSSISIGLILFNYYRTKESLEKIIVFDDEADYTGNDVKYEKQRNALLKELFKVNKKNNWAEKSVLFIAVFNIAAAFAIILFT